MGVSTAKRAASDAKEANALLEQYQQTGDPNTLATAQQDYATSQWLQNKAAQSSGGLGGFFQEIAPIALPLLGAFLGPEVFGAGSLLGGAAGLAGNTALGALGGGLGGFAGSEIGGENPLLGTALGALGGGISGAGGLSAFGDSAGGLFGNPTFGTDIANGISNTASGVGDTLGSAFGFGGNPAYTDPSITGQFAQGLGSGSTTEFSPAGAGGTAGTLGSGFSPSISGAGSLGGGSSGGFLQGLDTGSLGAGNQGGGFLGSTIGAADNASASGLLGGSGNVLSQPATYDAFNANGVNNAFQNAASQTIGQPMDFTAGGGNQSGGLLQSLLGGGGGNNNMLNGLLRTSLSSLFNQNPYSGYPQIANTLNQSAAQYNPFIQQGQSANTAIGNLEGLNGQQAMQNSQQNWQNTPGYQFQLQQGLGTLQNSAAANGGLLTGNTMQALQNYGQGLANTTYNQYLGNLQQQAGQGLNAIGPQSQLQGQAAQLQQMPGQYKAGQNNQALGGLFGSLFPQQGLTLNPTAGGGYNFSNGGGGLFSFLNSL